MSGDAVIGRAAGLRSRLLRRFWDAHSDGWNEMRSAPASRAHITTVVGGLIDRLAPAGLVVDLGCGAGQYAVEVAARGHPVVGIDYSPAMLALARSHAAELGVTIDLRECDLDEAIPFAPETVDAVMMVSVLQVVRDPKRVLDQIHRALRPGGYLLIESVRRFGALSHGRELSARDRLINATKKAVIKIPGMVKLYRSDDIGSLCRASGLHVVECATYEATFVVVARKS